MKNEVFHYGFQETAHFVTFTEEIRNGKLHFLCNSLVFNTLAGCKAQVS